MKKLSQQIVVNKNSLSLWERAERQLNEIQNIGFKPETIEEHRAFVDSIQQTIDAMDAKVKVSDLTKTMTL